MSSMKFEVGQRWRFACRPHEGEGVVTVHRLEGDTVHVALTDVSLFNGSGTTTTVGHLPISVDALRSSVTTQLDAGAVEPDTFRQGYDHWAAAKGGVFSVSLAKVLDVVERGMCDPELLLDHAIRTMRELQTDDAIRYAMATVLVQPRFCFIRNPDNPSGPLFWVFDGYPMCIPVFTSEARATRFVADSNLGTPAFMSAPGGEAIEWMLGSLTDEVVYASLNVGHELSLPVYFDMLRRVRTAEG